MKKVDPVAVWDVRPWGCDTFRVDDFNGDGKHEVLFLQTSGCHADRRHDPRVPEFRAYKTGIEEQELFCMTLVDGEGNILWQVGDPWALDRLPGRGRYYGTAHSSPLKKSIRAAACSCDRITALRSLPESPDSTRSRALSSVTMARPRLQSDLYQRTAKQRTQARF